MVLNNRLQQNRKQAKSNYTQQIISMHRLNTCTKIQIEVKTRYKQVYEIKNIHLVHCTSDTLSLKNNCHMCYARGKTYHLNWSSSIFF